MLRDERTAKSPAQRRAASECHRTACFLQHLGVTSVSLEIPSTETAPFRADTRDDSATPRPRKLPLSEKRLAANRANAQKSTGPVSPEGKARSRANAVKHGLTGEGIALPPELDEPLQRRRDALNRELQPGGVIEQILVDRLAVTSVRLEIHARQEFSKRRHRVRKAGLDWDELQASEADHWMGKLERDPVRAVRMLRRSAEGCDAMIRAWEELARVLESHRSWSDQQMRHATHLLGQASFPTSTSEPRLADFGLAALTVRRTLDPNRIARFFRPLDELLNPGSPPPKLADFQGRFPSARDAMATLRALITEEIEQLQRQRDRIWNEVDAPARRDAAERVLIDDGPETSLMLRYESTSDLAFHRALKTLERRRKLGLDPNQEEPVPSSMQHADDPTPEATAVSEDDPARPSAFDSTDLEDSKEVEDAFNPSAEDERARKNEPTPAGSGRETAAERSLESPARARAGAALPRKNEPTPAATEGWEPLRSGSSGRSHEPPRVPRSLEAKAKATHGLGPRRPTPDWLGGPSGTLTDPAVPRGATEETTGSASRDVLAPPLKDDDVADCVVSSPGPSDSGGGAG